MTLAQYKSELGVIESKLKALFVRKQEIRAAFLKANAEFGVGDKVRLIWNETNIFGKTQPETRMEVYISEVNDKYFHGRVNYEFVKAKKDGSISKSPAGIYSGYSRIELIEKAKSGE